MRVDEVIVGQEQPEQGERRLSRDRVARLSRIALSPRFSFVDVPSGRSDSVLVLGSGRSGTTWLAELINYRNEFRTIWEPFNTLYSSMPQGTGFRWGAYRHPRDPDSALEVRLRLLFEGRERSRWIDGHNTRRLPRRRLVKSIEMTNLADWIRLRLPEVPIAYLVRHPFAFADSHLALGWPAITAIDAEVRAGAEQVVERLDRATRQAVHALSSSSDDTFERLVHRWCLENVLALRRPSPGVCTIFYEDLVLDTATELDRLGSYLGVEFDETALVHAALPSRTDFRSRASARSAGIVSTEAFVADWRTRVSPDQRARGLRVLEAFGLDEWYADGPLPGTRRTDGQEALSTVR